MSTQPNLDFYAHVPTRREAAHVRLAELRNPMYAWRGDAAESVFDPDTGARRPQQRLYTPQPTQHPVRDHLSPHRSGHHSGVEDSSGSSNLHSRGKVEHAAASGRGEKSEVDATDVGTIWDAAASPAGDRRRWWRQTNFTFSADYFGTRGTEAAGPLAEFAGHSNAHASDTFHHDGVSSGGNVGVYKPYFHDTIVLCKPAPPRARTAGSPSTQLSAHQRNSGGSAPQRRRSAQSGVVLAVTCNAAEARARELQAAEDAKSGELLSLSSLSPVPRMPASKKSVGYTFAPSPTHCFDEAADALSRTAAAAAAAGTMHSSITGAPYTSVEGAARPSATSLDEEMSTPGDMRLQPSASTAGNGTYHSNSNPNTQSYHRHRNSSPHHNGSSHRSGREKTILDALHSSKATTWCDVVGPTMAGKQRVLTMAEGIYSDLVAGEAQRTGTAYGSHESMRMAAVPTCELAYSLRASYMNTKTTASLAHGAAQRRQQQQQQMSQPQREHSHSRNDDHHSSSSPYHGGPGASASYHHRRRSTHNYSATTAAAVEGSGGNLLPRSATYLTTGSLPSKIVGASSTILSRSAAGPGASHLSSNHHHQHQRSLNNTQDNNSTLHAQSGSPLSSRQTSLQRPASSSNTALSSSGKQLSSLYEKGPHRRTITAVGPNGLVGASFFEGEDDLAELSAEAEEGAARTGHHEADDLKNSSSDTRKKEESGVLHSTHPPPAPQLPPTTATATNTTADTTTPTTTDAAPKADLTRALPGVAVIALSAGAAKAGEGDSSSLNSNLDAEHQDSTGKERARMSSSLEVQPPRQQPQPGPSPPTPRLQLQSPSVQACASDHSVASSSDAAGSPMISPASPLGPDTVPPPASVGLTAPPTLSQYDLEREMLQESSKLMSGSRPHLSNPTYEEGPSHAEQHAHSAESPPPQQQQLEHGLLQQSRDDTTINTRNGAAAAAAAAAHAKDSPLAVHGQARRSSRNTASPKSDTACGSTAPPPPPLHCADSLLGGTQTVAGWNGDNSSSRRCPTVEEDEDEEGRDGDGYKEKACGALSGQYHGHVHGGNARPRRGPVPLPFMKMLTRQHRYGSARGRSASSRSQSRSRAQPDAVHRHNVNSSTGNASATTRGASSADKTAEAHRLPAEAKETRVYAVRVRSGFTNADASLVKRQEPPRRGVPVLLPDDWQ